MTFTLKPPLLLSGRLQHPAAVGQTLPCCRADCQRSREQREALMLCSVCSPEAASSSSQAGGFVWVILCAAEICHKVSFHCSSPKGSPLSPEVVLMNPCAALTLDFSLVTFITNFCCSCSAAVANPGSLLRPKRLFLFFLIAIEHRSNECTAVSKQRCVPVRPGPQRPCVVQAGSHSCKGSSWDAHVKGGTSKKVTEA